MKTLVVLLSLGLLGGTCLWNYARLHVDTESRVAMVSPVVTPSPLPNDPRFFSEPTTYPVTETYPSDEERRELLKTNPDQCITLSKYTNSLPGIEGSGDSFDVEVSNSCSFVVDSRLSLIFYDREGVKTGDTVVYINSIPANGKAKERGITSHNWDDRYEYSFENKSK